MHYRKPCSYLYYLIASSIAHSKKQATAVSVCPIQELHVSLMSRASHPIAMLVKTPVRRNDATHDRM